MAQQYLNFFRSVGLKHSGSNIKAAFALFGESWRVNFILFLKFCDLFGGFRYVFEKVCVP
jgi:hypothetical protein